MVTRVYVPTSTEGDVENNTFESLTLLYTGPYTFGNQKQKKQEALRSLNPGSEQRLSSQTTWP